MAPGPALSWATENARSARRHGRRWPLHDWCWLSPPLRWVAMIGAGSVHPCGGSRRLGYIGDTHCCLLAAEAVERHPVVLGRGCRSLTDRRSMAHSPVASRRVLGHLRLTESARRRPRPGGVSTFRMRELRPGWAPLYAEAYIWSLSSRLHYRLLRFGAISIAKRMRKA
jgi:hypothetical protein